MNDMPTPPSDSTDRDASPRRRKGLNVPLPAVVVGLGLASSPAVAQIPVVARDDAYLIPPDALAVLPVRSNDTVNNVAATFFTLPVIPPKGHNVVVQGFDLLYRPPNGFRGAASFDYCLQSVSPVSNSCATVILEVGEPTAATPVPALGGAALLGLSGALGWLGVRLRRRG